MTRAEKFRQLAVLTTSERRVHRTVYFLQKGTVSGCKYCVSKVSNLELRGECVAVNCRGVPQRGEVFERQVVRLFCLQICSHVFLARDWSVKRHVK